MVSRSKQAEQESQRFGAAVEVTRSQPAGRCHPFYRTGLVLRWPLPRSC